MGAAPTATAVVVFVVFMFLRAVSHGDWDTQNRGCASLGDVFLEEIALVRGQSGEIGTILDELPRGQRVAALHGVVERGAVEVVPLVELCPVLHQELQDTDVTAVGGEVERRAAPGESFRHAHLEVRVNPSLERDLDELPGAAQGASVQGRPLVDHGGEHFLDERAVAANQLFGPLHQAFLLVPQEAQKGHGL